MPGPPRSTAALHKINTINQKKQRLPEVYGFVGWITSFVAYAIYLLWAYLPESVLHQIGVTYYPSKYWAVVIPMYIVVTFLLCLFFYLSMNLMATEPLDSSKLLRDEHTKHLSEVELLNEESIPPIADIPITTVSRLLYSKHNVRRVLGEDSASSSSAPSRFAARSLMESTPNVIQAQPATNEETQQHKSQRRDDTTASSPHLRAQGPPPSFLHPSPSSPALFAHNGPTPSYLSGFSSYAPSYPSASSISPYFSPGALRATKRSHSRSHSSSSAQLALLSAAANSPRVHPSSPVPPASPGSPSVNHFPVNSVRRRTRPSPSSSFEFLPQASLPSSNGSEVPVPAKARQSLSSSSPSISVSSFPSVSPPGKNGSMGTSDDLSDLPPPD